MKKPIRFLPILAAIAFFFTLPSCFHPSAYIINDGKIYGTLYHIVYESPRGTDLHAEIDSELNRLNMIFSTFNPESQISKINSNREVVLDSLFIKCFNRSMEISEQSGGAFDITVAPLVNAWGFGFRKKEQMTPALIDSLLKLTGYSKVSLVNGKVMKKDTAMMLDMSAIAKGFTCDIIGHFLAGKGCLNYLVEIGGEVVAKGLNPKGEIWNIGISRPDENSFISNENLQTVCSLNNRAMATSGNYRNFYIENGKKFAHEIDPKTGYPVQHNLLSATVIADDCMTADAWATAFMILGLEKSGEIHKKIPEIEVYFIYSDDSGFDKIYMSDNFKEILQE